MLRVREYFSKGGREERGEWKGELRREKGVGDAEIWSQKMCRSYGAPDEAGAQKRQAKEKRKYLTWRIKSEILDGLEVSYVPSSFPVDAAFHDTVSLRRTTRNTTPTFLLC
jgi:hypothetical protein